MAIYANLLWKKWCHCNQAGLSAKKGMCPLTHLTGNKNLVAEGKRQENTRGWKAAKKKNKVAYPEISGVVDKTASFWLAHGPGVSPACTNQDAAVLGGPQYTKNTSKIRDGMVASVIIRCCLLCRDESVTVAYANGQVVPFHVDNQTFRLYLSNRQMERGKICVGHEYIDIYSARSKQLWIK